MKAPERFLINPCRHVDGQLQKDRGKNRYVAEFTLVILQDDYADDYREYVDRFVGYVNARFGDAVVYAER